jgi:signal transduction histidine kinase
MINRLRWRFIRVAMLAVTLVLVLLLAAVNIINFVSTNSDFHRLLTMITDNNGALPMEQNSGPGNWTGGPRYTEETPFTTRYFVLRYTETGEQIWANWDNIAAVGQEDGAYYVSVALRHGVGTGYKGSYVYQVTKQGDGTYLAVFLNCQRELSALRTYALGSLGAGLGCAVLVYLLILLFSKYAIRPTVESLQKQKQFITDASHELKTPLTVISTSQTVLELEVGHQKWIDKTMAQVEKMRTLVDELVTLSRMDEEQPQLQITWFDASEAVGETADSFRDFAQAQGHPLVLEIPQGITFCGDQLGVRRLVSVLMDNGVKYCEKGGTISLLLCPTKRGIELRVKNPCQPMAREELDRLFDRFYRVDHSRSRQTGGFGVGLSIARSIAETHHGSIRAHCPQEGTIEFVAQLTSFKRPNVECEAMAVSKPHQH